MTQAHTPRNVIDDEHFQTPREVEEGHLENSN